MKNQTAFQSFKKLIYIKVIHPFAVKAITAIASAYWFLEEKRTKFNNSIRLLKKKLGMPVKEKKKKEKYDFQR